MEFLAVLLTSVLPKDFDHWHSQMLYGEVGVCLWISWEIFKKIHVIPAFAFLYFSTYAIVCQFRVSEFFLYAQGDLQPQFDTAVARSLVFFLMCVIPFIFCTKKSLINWLVSFRGLAVVDSIVMIYKFFFVWSITGHHATGLIGMDSIDGSFLAIMLPLVISEETQYKKTKMVYSSLMIIAMVLAKSSTVYALMAVELFMFLGFKFWERKNFIYLAAMAAMVSGVKPLGHLYLGKELLNSNGRENIINLSKEFFLRVHHYWLGIGTGSFISILPFIEGRKPSGFFVFMHSEPLQVLFEQGIFGLGLLIMVFGLMLYKSRKNYPMLVSVTVCGLQSFLQPCFRYFLFSLFMAFMCRLSLGEKECQMR
jgi:O-antigen ligase